MKKLLLALSIVFLLASCGEDDAPQPQTMNNPTVIDPEDDPTMVKFTLYSNRVPFVFRREVNNVWKSDSIKTNNAVIYEPYDVRHLGAGFFVTHNTSGQSTDQLSIQADYQGKTTYSHSAQGLSFAFVLLDDLE